MVPPQGSVVLHRLIWGKTLKILCETRRHRPVIFGMSLYKIHIFYGCFAKLIKAKFHTKLLWDTETKGLSKYTSYQTHMFHSLKMLP